jgi:hypothetical protein
MPNKLKEEFVTHGIDILSSKFRLKNIYTWHQTAMLLLTAAKNASALEKLSIYLLIRIF